MKPLTRPHVLSITPFAVLLLVLLCTFFVYASGLTGIFLFDDEPNITTNDRVQITELSLDELWHAAFSLDLGPGILKRPLSRVSFALNHYFFGLDPYAFKLINVLIHLLNGVSLFLCLWLLLNLYHELHGTPVCPSHGLWVSLAVSTVWLLHPLNLTTVLYVVQRMNGMAAFFSFWTITLYLWGRRSQLQGDRGFPWIVASFMVTIPLAALSKENALILPGVLLLTEWIVLGFRALTLNQQRLLKGLLLLTVGIPGVLASLFLITHLDWLLASYTSRPFNLYERILTESRVLWFYVSLIVLPIPSRLGLYHDDFQLSRGLLEPMTTLPALLSLIALAVTGIMLRRKAPIASLGILFFFVGHAMESTILSLEIAHEHRNYFPIVGPLLAIVYSTLRPVPYIPLRNALWAVGILWTLYLGVITTIRSDYWGNPAEHILVTAAYHPNSARTNYEAGRFYYFLVRQAKTDLERETYYLKARQYFSGCSKADKHYTGGLLGVIWLDAYLNKSVNESVLVELLHRLEHAPMASMSASNLQRLNQCQMAGECTIPDEVVDSLLGASLKNPTIPNRERAMLLSETMNRALIGGDLAQALSISKLAVNYNPKHIQHQLNMIHLLIVSNRLIEAKTALSRISLRGLSETEQQRLQQQQVLLHQREQYASDHDRTFVEGN